MVYTKDDFIIDYVCGRHKKSLRVNDGRAEVNIYNIGGPVKPYALKTGW